MPQNRRYEKTVTTQFKEELWLSIDVISTIYPNEQTLYTVRMIELAGEERSLNYGRFVHFEDGPQEHLVVTEFKFDYYDTIESFCRKLIDWISENVKNPWSFTITMDHVSDLKIHWSFSDVSEALRFKLTF